MERNVFPFLPSIKSHAQFLNECEFNGHYYALPYMRSTEACYVNKTYVEKLGFTLPEILTWDFVFEVCSGLALRSL